MPVTNPILSRQQGPRSRAKTSTISTTDQPPTSPARIAIAEKSGGLGPCIGPLSEATDGKEPMEGYTLNLVHPKEVRSIGGHRHNGWRKYRRPRPRLSHKGPMPF